MKFHEFGDSKNPNIMLIHGGGNSWWNYLRQARELSHHYHVILPTLDGHGEEYSTEYVSTEQTADDLMTYIETYCDGHLFALCGVSLGGQIVMELLSRNPNITKKAIIDGSLCIPQPLLAYCCMIFVLLFGKLIFNNTACRLQLFLMSKLFPPKMVYNDEIKAYYLEDMPRIRMKTLYSMYRTYMKDYQLKSTIRNSTAQVMYWYGEKEMNFVKRSAKKFQEFIPSCEIYEAKGYNHGYLSVYLPEEWLRVAVPFFERASEQPR